jgi:beta-glucanase (GH16 family)
MPGCPPVLTGLRGLRRLLPVAAAVLIACTAITTASPGPAAPPTEAGYAMYDDFDGPAGAPPNPRYWGYDLGSPGAANNERQVYTNSPDNVRLDGQGHLVIEAQKTQNGYTSGRIVTRGRVDMMYGTLAARIKFPAGQGIWPAFWTLGSNMASAGWPESGEIDIMELVNSGSTYHVTLHGPQGNSDYLGGDGVGTSGPIADLTNDFHEYWLHWQPDNITIGVDGTTLATFTPSSLPPGARWVFNHPMYAVLNVAVGGDWPGPPDASTPFPATMLVDWVRYTP